MIMKAFDCFLVLAGSARLIISDMNLKKDKFVG